MEPMRYVRTWMAVAGLAAIALFSSPAGAQRSGKGYFVYFGTYTRNVGKGIYAYRFDPATGRLTSMGLAAETPSPAFLVVHPNGRFLYAANEHDGEDTPGKNNTVSAFAIDPVTGKLTFLNKVSSGGEGPCYVSMDRGGRTLLVANYRSGSVAALPIQRDGRLRDATAFDQHPDPPADPAPTRPHVHGVVPSPDDRFALAADPPLDRVYVYRFDPAKGTLAPNDPAFVQLGLALGPRHLVFGPSGTYVYVNDEQGSAISTFAYQAAKGTLKEIQTLSTLPAGFSGRSATAEVHIDRAGRFLYVSNRGHDSIAIFSIDQAKGTLRLVDHAPAGGKTPRYFAFDPSGRFLMVANQNSASVVVNRVDVKTGRLTPVQTLTDIPEPVCIVFVPAVG